MSLPTNTYRGSRSSSRNSLLGVDDESNKRLIYAEESEDIFDRENEHGIEELEKKAAEMRRLGGAIEIEITESMRSINEVHSGLNSVQGALDNSMKRLKELTKTASTRHMCYLVLFIVLVFLILYFLFV